MWGRLINLRPIGSNRPARAFTNHQGAVELVS